MGFLDKAKAKLTDAVDQHGDKIADGIDKAGKLADEKTGGKHADKINQADGQGPRRPRQPRRQERRHPAGAPGSLTALGSGRDRPLRPRPRLLRLPPARG